MKYYSDRAKAKELGKEFSLGTVDAGETKKYSVWAFNDYGTYIKDLKFVITKVKLEDGKKIVTDESHPEINLVKAPENLPVNEVGEIVFTWSPTVTLKEHFLVSINMTGKEEW